MSLNSSIIIPRIFGGIGNQLFCYAAARRLALVNNAELVIDHVSGFKHDYKYQRQYQLYHFNLPCRKATAAERLEPFSKIRRYFKRRINQHLPFENRRYIQQQGTDFDSRLLKVKPLGTVHIEGYWQSEKYFGDVAPIIRQDLQIQPPIDSKNKDMADSIEKHMAVAMHVRFFDEPDVKGVHNASANYYHRAILEMEQRVPAAHYYLFSDRPKEAQRLIPLPDSRTTVVDHNQGDAMAYADLWLMSQCRHFIIANSTFSWWGAWLAAQPDKIVIAPVFRLINFGRHSITSWGFEGLLQEMWIKI
jgi:hypothetical protein